MLNVGTEHLGLGYIDTLEQMAKVKRCVLDVVLPEGTVVLNADDVFVAGMADTEYCKCSVLFFSHEAKNPVLSAHREKDGRAVFVEENAIYLAEGDKERRLCALSEVGIPTSGHFVFNVQNVLAAIGAAWAYGLDDATIVQQLGNYS